MMLTREDYKTPDEELYNKIQTVYSAYFKPEMEYKHGSFSYTNAPDYVKKIANTHRVLRCVWP